MIQSNFWGSSTQVSTKSLNHLFVFESEPNENRIFTVKHVGFWNPHSWKIEKISREFTGQGVSGFWENQDVAPMVMIKDRFSDS